MDPPRYPERRPGRPRLPWHAPPDRAPQETYLPGSRLGNAYARTTTPDGHMVHLYHDQYRFGPAPHEPVFVLDRLRDQRRGAQSFGSPGMPPPPLPPFPPPGLPSVNSAAISEAERNRLRNSAPVTQGFGSPGMPPPPFTPFPHPEVPSNHPAAISVNRERHPTLASMRYPPLPSSEFPSFDEVPSQGTANLNNDERRTGSAAFQEAVERNRLRNPEPFARGSGLHGLPRVPAPPPAPPLELTSSNERPSQGTTDSNNGSYSAAIQEAVEYNRGLAARGTGSRRRHPPLPAPEPAPPLSVRDRTLEAMNRAPQPPNRRAQPMSEIHARLTSEAHRVNESGARIGETSSPHQDPSVAYPNFETNITTRSDTRPRTVPTRHEFLGRDFRAGQIAEQRASYERLSNEKIESFVQALPVHLILDLPDDKQNCDICLEKYYGPQQREGPIRLPCNHVLGKQCLLKWLKSPATNRNNNCCPVCRTVLLERVHLFSSMDDSPSSTFSERLDDIFDHYEEGFTDQWTGLGDDNQARRDPEHERITIERVRERMMVERAERERTMTERDQEHESWFREREEEHARELNRLRQEHAEQMEMLQGMRAERRTGARRSYGEGISDYDGGS